MLLCLQALLELLPYLEAFAYHLFVCVCVCVCMLSCSVMLDSF